MVHRLLQATAVLRGNQEI